MSEVFDPFALDNPQMRLGSLGVFRVGDLTKTRQATIQDIGLRLEDASTDGDSADDDAVRLICEQVATMMDEAPDTLAADLFALYEADQIGLRALMNAQQHILRWVGLEDARPNE